LKSLTLGNGVKTIESLAFYQCTSLTGTLIIPDSVTSIGKNAFEACSNISSITWKGKAYTDKGEFNKAIGVIAWA
jgi:hypothetical protein